MRFRFHDGSCVRLRPTHKDHGWSYDFVAEHTSDGRALRMLNIIDEYTRECIAGPCRQKDHSSLAYRPPAPEIFIPYRAANA